MSKISLAQLMEVGVHFGHKTDIWNPKMFQYIHTERNKMHLLDLVQSAQLLKEALCFTERAAKNKKTFLFIGTKKQARRLIAQEAKRCDSSYVNYRWLGGMLTNWVTLKSRIARLKELEQQEVDQTFDLLPKKEASLRLKELEKLRRQLNGIKNMTRLPDIAIVVDQKRETTAVRECRKLGITVVSFLDTNCDPDLADIPIPANDDGVRSIEFILQSLADSIIAGRHSEVA
uniref:Small ribosomal subunit protein uS2c n=1 Tax=Proboscia sp. TaxID=1923967 RepID=A0A2U9NLZ8_9STRA|nr:ribosomal protein S2 [Proboscia sp.]